MLLALLLLAACTPAEPDSAETEVEAPSAESSQENDAEEPTPTAPSPVDEPEVTETEAVVEEKPTVNEEIAGFPATNFEEAAVLRERDWFKGAEEPVVEIIEYGDFQ